MICPNCWCKPHPDADAEKFFIEMLEPQLPDELKDDPQSKSFWEDMVGNTKEYCAIVIVAGKETAFAYRIPCVERARVRWSFVCQNCGFVWDHFEGDPHLETYKLSPELKFHLILWPIIAFFASTILCSAIWAYNWKQVKMAENGFEKVEAPSNSGGTVTEWRKVKEKEKGN